MNILSKLHGMDNFVAVNCCCVVIEFVGELLPVYLRHFCPVADIHFVFLIIDTDKHFSTVVAANEVNIVR
jgi:hypothetical protein